MKHVLAVAQSLLGVRYRYGGGSPDEGVDCNEVVQIILNAGGADLPGDQTAQALFDHFSQPANHLSQDPALGSLVFYGQSRKQISHVAWCIDARRHIEAAGGDRTTITPAIAHQRKAFVRLTPIRFFAPNFIGAYLIEYPLSVV